MADDRKHECTILHMTQINRPNNNEPDQRIEQIDAMALLIRNHKHC